MSVPLNLPNSCLSNSLIKEFGLVVELDPKHTKIIAAHKHMDYLERIKRDSDNPPRITFNFSA